MKGGRKFGNQPLSVFMKKLAKVAKILCAPFYYLDYILTSTPGMVLIFAPAGIALVVGIICYFRDLFIRKCLGEGLGLVVMTILYFGALSIICSIIAIAFQALACVLRFICYPGVQIYYFCQKSLQNQDTVNQSSQDKIFYNNYEEDVFNRAAQTTNMNKQFYEERQKAREENEAAQKKQEELKKTWERQMYEKIYNKAYSDAADKINSSEKSKYEKARALFMLKDGYTEADLKKQYHRLLKAFHPDNEGTTNDEAQQINAAYHLLKKYAK